MVDTSPNLNARQVRSHMPKSAYDSRVHIGLPLFLALFSLYLGLWLAALSVQALWLKFLLGIVTGQAIGSLFVVGHDASHESLTGRPLLDRTLAILAFLPSLHPVCTWEIEHNKMHHAWTNLKGSDLVYAPMTPQEFDALSPFQKRLHRFYRSFGGFGCFYLFDIWLPVLILRRSKYCKNIPTHLLINDFFWVGLFLAMQIGMCFVFAATLSQAMWNILLCVILPFIVWNYVMAFITIQNHTHPSIKWFDDREEWCFYHAQVQGSVHTELPRWLDFAFIRVFHHTAHHIDQKIPVYRLKNAQSTMEDTFKDDVKVILFNLSEFRKILYDCQLYDYRNHQWLRFPKADQAVPAE
ncbi:MAG: fatty acid desaturase [Beijerinckiaceae bacterium]|nr:fatty acid desaturase [Beijerinckiaceae bacterium]